VNSLTGPLIKETPLNFALLSRKKEALFLIENNSFDAESQVEYRVRGGVMMIGFT